MARYRRKAKTYRARTRASYSVKRRSRSRSSKLGSVAPYLMSAGYGALRAKASQMLQPLTSKLPLGNYAEEGSLILASWGIGKLMPRAKAYLRPVAMIESFKIGQKLMGSYSAPLTTQNSVSAYG